MLRDIFNIKTFNKKELLLLHQNRNGQSGQVIIIFIVVFVLLLMGLGLGMLDLSTIYSQQNTAYNIANSAAETGASMINTTKIYQDQVTLDPTLSWKSCEKIMIKLAGNNFDSNSNCTLVNNGNAIEATYVDSFSLPFTTQIFGGSRYKITVTAYAAPVAGG